jgi:hypothetical protein
MNNLFAFFDRLQAAFGTTPPYLQVVLKALFAVAGSLIAWFILKRIFVSFRKKTQNQDFIQINAQIYNLIEKAIYYGLIIVAGTYLIRLFNVLMLEKIFHAFLIILLAAPLNDFMLIVLAYLEEKVANQTTTKIDNIIFDLLQNFWAPSFMLPLLSWLWTYWGLMLCPLLPEPELPALPSVLPPKIPCQTLSPEYC